MRLCVASIASCCLFCFLIEAVQAQTELRLVHGGHTYELVKTRRNWSDAATDAGTRQVQSVPGHLVVIESAEENTALFSHLTRTIASSEYANTQAPDGGNGVYVWIAASDRTTEGTWIWDGDGDGSGDTFWRGTGRNGGQIVDGRYNNWGHFPDASQQWEPDNSSNGLQDVGGIGVRNWPRGFAGEWNDIRADNSLYYLVEFDTLPRIGDANLDEIVDAADLEILKGNLFKPGSWFDGDFNQDGNVDGQDFNIWNASWTPTANMSVVPEPTAAFIGMVAVTVIWMARW